MAETRKCVIYDDDSDDDNGSRHSVVSNSYDVTSDDDDCRTVISDSYDGTSGDDDNGVETEPCAVCVSYPECAGKCAACSEPFCSSPCGSMPHPYLPRLCPNDYGVYVCGVATDDLINFVSHGAYWLVENTDALACGKHVCGKCIFITGRCRGCIKVGTI